MKTCILLITLAFASSTMAAAHRKAPRPPDPNGYYDTLNMTCAEVNYVVDTLGDVTLHTGQERATAHSVPTTGGCVGSTPFWVCTKDTNRDHPCNAGVYCDNSNMAYYAQEKWQGVEFCNVNKR